MTPHTLPGEGTAHRPSAEKEDPFVPETPSRTLYLGTGEFAARLLDHRHVPASARTTLEHLERDARAGDTVVVVHDGAASDLRDAVDRFGAERDLASVGVQLLPTRIVCGPAVVPHSTACWRCHRKRAAQHAGGSHEFDVDSSVSGLPEGFGPSHLLLASGLLDLALVEIDSRRQTDDPAAGLGGTVRTANLVSGGVSAAETVATDRCPRCGDRFATSRTHAAAASFPELAPRI